jgi:MOB kinase activator 1
MPLFDFLKRENQGTLEFKYKKPKKKLTVGSRQYTLKQSLKASLGNGQMIKESVKLPPGEDMNEWIAMNTIELYNTMNLCYGIVSEFCTETSCPQMTAGPKVTYFWADNKNKKEKPVSLPAPEYIEKLVVWISEQLDDQTIFPENSSDFGKNFLPTAKKILSRMFRVYAHVYHSHWEKVKSLGAEAHINTCFKHFYYFTNEFQLIDDKDMEPMKSLIDKLNN